MGRRGLGRERRSRTQAQKASAREGGQDLGKGVGQGRHRGGLAEAHASARLHGIAQEMGCGEDLFLALSEQEDELRDYERLPESSEAFIYAAMSRLMARRRLARA